MQCEGLRSEAERLEKEAHGAAQELALRELDCCALRGQLAATHEAAGASMRRVEALSSELARSRRSQVCLHCLWRLCQKPRLSLPDSSTVLYVFLSNLLHLSLSIWSFFTVYEIRAVLPKLRMTDADWGLPVQMPVSQ